MNNVKLHFLIKFLTKYFFYGYLCFFGIIIFSLITYLVMKNLLFPMNLFGLLSFLILIPIFVQFVRIIISTKQKYRYYKITKYRLENREFKEEFFLKIKEDFTNCLSAYSLGACACGATVTIFQCVSLLKSTCCRTLDRWFSSRHPR